MQDAPVANNLDDSMAVHVPRLRSQSLHVGKAIGLEYYAVGRMPQGQGQRHSYVLDGGFEADAI